MKNVTPLGGDILIGCFIALEPLGPANRDSLLAAFEAGVFTHMPYDVSKGYAPVLEWHESENTAGRYISYVVRRLSDGAVMGSTSYLNIAPEHAKVEVGSTWYRKEAQGGFVNPEAKYLLLKNAFDKGWNRVEFKTDSRNAQSRAALTKLGAKEEGILRGHMWVHQGYFRDSVYFSVIASEWPTVRAGLEKRLAAFA
jgi:RimJ/RimL family protein N-acetyltransferase